jgi:hypothetical protein
MMTPPQVFAFDGTHGNGSKPLDQINSSLPARQSIGLWESKDDAGIARFFDVRRRAAHGACRSTLWTSPISEMFVARGSQIREIANSGRQNGSRIAANVLNWPSRIPSAQVSRR